MRWPSTRQRRFQHRSDQCLRWIKYAKRNTVRHHSLANNGILGHDREVLTGDDITVTSGGNKNVGTWGSILHGGDLVTSHCSLEGVDGVDLRDEDTSTIRLQGFSTLKFVQSNSMLRTKINLLLCRRHRNRRQRRPCQQA